MTTKLLAVVTGMVLALGAVGAGAEPGPDETAGHGTCTAYFNGSEKGREHKRDAPPFQQLEEDAGDDGAWTYCNDGANNEKGVGGRPTDPDGNRTKPKERRGE